MGIVDVFLSSTTSTTLLGWFMTALVSAFFISRQASKKRDDMPKKSLPPKAPGNIFQIAPLFFSKQAPFHLLDMVKKTNERIMRMPLAPPGGYFIMVADYRVARAILENPRNTKDRFAYQMFNRVFGGDTFFTAEGQRFKHVRKSTSLAFAPQQVKRMTSIIETILEEWIQSVLNPSIAQQEPVDMAEEMQRLTIRIICMVGFEYELTKKQAELLLESLKISYLEYSVKANRNPLRNTIVGCLFPEVRRARQATLDMRGICRRILATHGPHSHPHTVLSLVVNDDEYRDNEERVRDLLTYLAGGYDSTSYTIAWTLLELARNPGEQEYLRDELRKYGAQNGSLIQHCPALKRVIRESMRLHAVAALGSIRVLQENLVVPNSNMYIPAKAVCFTPFTILHRDPNVYSNPGRFDPSRWEKPSDAALQSFLPFSCGRRNCQGQALANAEIGVILARLCANYQFTVTDPGTTEYYVTLKTVNSLLLARKA